MDEAKLTLWVDVDDPSWQDKQELTMVGGDGGGDGDCETGSTWQVTTILWPVVKGFSVSWARSTLSFGLLPSTGFCNIVCFWWLPRPICKGTCFDKPVFLGWGVWTVEGVATMAHLATSIWMCLRGLLSWWSDGTLGIGELIAPAWDTTGKVKLGWSRKTLGDLDGNCGRYIVM